MVCQFAQASVSESSDRINLRLRLSLLTHTELIVAVDRLVVLEVDFYHLFSLQDRAGLIAKSVGNLSGLTINDVATGRDHIPAINGYEYPARHVGRLDARDLLGR